MISVADTGYRYGWIIHNRGGCRSLWHDRQLLATHGEQPVATSGLERVIELVDERIELLELAVECLEELVILTELLLDDARELRGPVDQGRCQRRATTREQQYCVRTEQGKQRSTVWGSKSKRHTLVA